MVNHPKNCLNCNIPLSEGDHYCSHCGQNAQDRLMSIGALFSTFWNSIFNFDNTIFQTLRYVFLPWQLTKYYDEGKRKDYLNPVRLFLITLLFVFGTIVSYVDFKDIDTKDEYVQVEKSKILEEYIVLKDSINCLGQNIDVLDSIQNKLFTEVKKTEFNSIYFTSSLLDSNINITRYDALHLPIDTLFKKYEIKSFKDKFILNQMIKFNFDRSGTVKYAIRNAAWGVFVLIFLLSGLLKLLYYRRHIHYVSHAVFLMNIHSMLFICAIAAILIFKILPSSSTFEAPIFIIFALLYFYTYYSFIKYYGQGYLKTFIKFIIINFIYVTFGLITLVGAGAFSLIFF